MKISRYTTRGLALALSLTITLAPVTVWAEEDLPLSALPVPLAPVIITELQTGQTGMSGGGKAADEFIELYNTTAEPQDITGWHLAYFAASAESITPKPALQIELGSEESPAVINPGAYYVVHAGTVVLPEGAAGYQYDSSAASITKTGGSLVLFKPDALACKWLRQDSLAWQGGKFGEGTAVSLASTSKDKSFQRYRDAQGGYIDSGNNTADFKVMDIVTPSPSTPGTGGLAVSEGSPALLPVQPLERVMDDCTLPDTSDDGADSPPLTTNPVIEPPVSAPEPEPALGSSAGPVYPAADIGLTSPQISELLPNPGSPKTDSADEFIELYNSNATTFDLSGFVLESGLTTKRRYTFPAGTMLEPLSFRTFFSTETGLTMSNASGQVVLRDPFGNNIAQTGAYQTAKDDQAWVSKGGVWQWTLTPTPGAANVVTIPAPAKKKSSSQGSTAKTAGASSIAAKPAAGNAVATTNTSMVEDVATETPIHAAILAAVGVSAVLYGVYEYRHDLANKLFQLRSYRATRRANRAALKGRGSN